MSEELQDGNNVPKKSKKVMLVGRSECGKTTLIQALEKRAIQYQKTQVIGFSKKMVDTPGEYMQVPNFGRALAVYAYETDIIAFLASSTEDYCVFSPNIVPHINREVVGIVTKCDLPGGYPDTIVGWLKNAGCKKIFKVSAYTGEGVDELRDYLFSD
ncbi:MAG: EutP/PduV family microcompartment system protein [Oscillospiraceae bacterium]